MLEEYSYRPLKMSFGLSSDEKSVLLSQCDRIKTLCENANNTLRVNVVSVGNILLEIERSRSYLRCHCSDNGWSCFSDRFFKGDPFFSFCKRYFGFSETKVRTLKGIALRFGNSDGSFLPNFERYGLSQLAEMIPMTKTQLAQCKPEMTVKELRALKQEESAAEVTPSAKEPKEPEKPKSTYVFYDMPGKSDLFRYYAKRFFESKHCKLTIDGVSVGGQAFGTMFLDYLNFRRFFDADTNLPSKEQTKILL